MLEHPEPNGINKLWVGDITYGSCRATWVRLYGDVDGPLFETHCWLVLGNGYEWELAIVPLREAI
ncbi:MAG: hypothetical protein R3C99_06555 [Pirellulaceae bacterium]